MRDLTPEEQASRLWHQYLAMSGELLKFIDQEDIDTFLELVDQRAALIEKMKALPAHQYRGSDDFNAVVQQIKPLDMQIIYKARTWLNKSRRQNSAVKAYDIANTNLSGNLFNRRY
jgi:hypothetical protein